MIKSIAVVTGSRAEYGLLKPLMSRVVADPDLSLQLIVTGSHHSPLHGNTRQIILDDGFSISCDVELPLPNELLSSTARCVGAATIGIADCLDGLKPDCVVVLGDRYEIFAAAQAALFCSVPVVHLHGGELTLGANDDALRHAITKMAHLHFVAADDYRRRVIQMGEEPARVFVSGALGLDVVKGTQFLSSEAVAAQFNCNLASPLLIVTYHPETNSKDNGLKGLLELFEALSGFTSHQILFTGSNADFMGEDFSERKRRFAASHSNMVFVQSLGHPGFISALSHAECIIGNSSSGIIEAPLVATSSVNIGSRQEGRLRARSVLDCQPDRENIAAAINRAISKPFISQIASMTTALGDGRPTQIILDGIKSNEKLLHTPKRFHDMGAA